MNTARSVVLQNAFPASALFGLVELDQDKRKGQIHHNEKNKVVAVHKFRVALSEVYVAAKIIFVAGDREPPDLGKSCRTATFISIARSGENFSPGLAMRQAQRARLVRDRLIRKATLNIKFGTAGIDVLLIAFFRYTQC